MTKTRLGGSEKQGQGMADLREQFVGFDQDAAGQVFGPGTVSATAALDGLIQQGRLGDKSTRQVARSRGENRWTSKGAGLVHEGRCMCRAGG